LRKGNVARRELFAETQHEAALHFQNEVGEPLGIGPELIEAVQAEWSPGFQTA
jgi:hypothetical protein